MKAPRSDALVLFGASGDLAHKKIFPALYAMCKRGKLDVAVIGVAKSGWTVDDLKSHAHDAISALPDFDESVFQHLAGLLKYVDGDYRDAANPRRRKNPMDSVSVKRHNY